MTAIPMQPAYVPTAHNIEFNIGFNETTSAPKIIDITWDDRSRYLGKKAISTESQTIASVIENLNILKLRLLTHGGRTMDHKEEKIYNSIATQLSHFKFSNQLVQFSPTTRSFTFRLNITDTLVLQFTRYTGADDDGYLYVQFREKGRLIRQDIVTIEGLVEGLSHIYSKI